jgi:hypothetical protein
VAGAGTTVYKGHQLESRDDPRVPQDEQACSKVRTKWVCSKRMCSGEACQVPCV